MHPYSLFTTANLVICFHHIPSQLWFRSALGGIRKFYRFVSADELESFFYEGRRFNSRCLLRFDDGDRSFYEHAFPVLKDLMVPAVLFVSPLVLGRGANYWFQDMAEHMRLLPDATVRKAIYAVTGRPLDEIQRCGVFAICKSLQIGELQKVLETLSHVAGDGKGRGLNIDIGQLLEISRSSMVTVGAHTLNHPILANEDDGVAAAEIGRSIADLSRMLDKEVRHFAYPNGLRGLDFDEREKNVLRAQGVTVAYSGETGFFGAHTDPLEIPRVGISGDRGSKKLWLTAKFLLAPVWDRIRADKEARERACIQKFWRRPAGSSASVQTQ